uniref:Uncharacterized protein n=1 Tax=Setaria italica TaxID=4555 RepID=K3YFG4_SETIT
MWGSDRATATEGALHVYFLSFYRLCCRVLDASPIHRGA